jgi:hypothetical protein
MSTVPIDQTSQRLSMMMMMMMLLLTEAQLHINEDTQFDKIEYY